MRELDEVLSGLTQDMRAMVSHLDSFLTESKPPLEVRIQSVAGVLAICYRIRRIESTRTQLFEIDPRTGETRWLAQVPDLDELKQLDRERQLLNHQYRIAFAERKSLRLLHRNLQILFG